MWETGKNSDDCECKFCEHKEKCYGYKENDDYEN